MKTSHILEDVLGQKSKVSILRLLYQETELSGREIAKRTGLSPRAAQQSLQNLYSQGILLREVAGASYLFSLNNERYVVNNILNPLFERESKLFDAVVSHILKVFQSMGVLSLALFGSVARGQGESGSDLDVLVLIEDDQPVSSISDRVRDQDEGLAAKFGMRISPYVIRRRDFISRFDKKDKLILNIVKEGHLLWGKSLGEVLMHGPKKSAH